MARFFSSLKVLEFILLFSMEPNTVTENLNQNKSFMTLFGVAYASNKGTTILYQFSNTNFFSIILVSHFQHRNVKCKLVF